ncbi:sterile alpha motif domain-containing protein 9-like [Anabas testudineus]|uniref:Sterile alpha motif domain-containing protein 9-like n=1 Tax=Anabas testudineus TaxID=64144 RepID=A0A3Q1IEE9_ANATE|nr:sterile alpha motif domain-containing protein 9-like [Anabas testudineus]
MANGPGLLTATGGEMYVGKNIRDSLPQLDVLYANQFEGESFVPKLTEQTEVNFYRGAPPIWLNFHISEQAGGTAGPLIKRDGYETLVQQIQQRGRPGISTVKLFHQPGSGGTTLAMQVLWDLRKTFRCAVLKSSTSDMTKVAQEVVHLFTAGGRGHQNTVLLLLDDEMILENLHERIMEEIAAQKIVPCMPVLVLLCCFRKDADLQSGHVVLEKALSDTEKEKFNEKKTELGRRYTDQCELFHGFNIMQTNFSQAYVTQACTVFSNVRRAGRPLKTQLAAFLALLNDYVPGSYVLESQCLDFLKKNKNDPLKDSMKPFSHLIVTFTQDSSSEKRVRMVHPMIAQTCTDLMAEAGVTRSDTARNLLNHFCRDEVPPYLLAFFKDMLTKRETTKQKNPLNSTEVEEKQQKFSRLILDIQATENEDMSASLLKVASNKFDRNPFFPQALARFYYIEMKNYNLAAMWAERAKKRDPKNSFIADTLGQVYKNQLKNTAISHTPREILHLATKAIEAFKHEEQLAEEEAEDVCNTTVLQTFNNRGIFGYLQVCNILYDRLVRQNETWRNVLTSSVSMDSVLDSLGDNKLFTFNDVIKSLREEVERKYIFFDKYLTYSKPSMKKDDAPYISEDTLDCFRKYVGDIQMWKKEKCDNSIQKLKQNLADTSTGVLSCLDRDIEITTWWEEIDSSPDSLTALANYIKQKLPLSPQEAPERQMLALILNWPTDGEESVFDLNQLIQRMHGSYERSYKKYFGSRYLCPLFFLGKGQRSVVLLRTVLERLGLNNQDWSNDWSDETIFQHPMIQTHLRKIEGVVQNCRVYATVGGTNIGVDANLRNSLWIPRQVSFYLGFTIRGPVAFGIQTKTA